MLILTRKLKESIYIGDTVRATVIDVEGENVSLLIESLDDVSSQSFENLDIRRSEFEAYLACSEVAEEGSRPPAEGEGVSRALANRIRNQMLDC